MDPEVLLNMFLEGENSSSPEELRIVVRYELMKRDDALKKMKEEYDRACKGHHRWKKEFRQRSDNGYKKVRVMIKEMGNLLTARGIELKRRREDGKRMLDMLSQCANRLDNLYGTIKTELETGMEMDEHEEGFIQQVRNLVLEITSHG